MSGLGASPTVQLHKLCSHLVGGAGGGEDLISSHYRSALQLLTSTTGHTPSDPASEEGVTDKIKKQLVREGRDRDAVRFGELHNKLKRSSGDILRNRVAILRLLQSLSEKSSSVHSAPVAFTTPAPSTSSTLRDTSPIPPPSRTDFHPPLPPKPRSRPNSMVLQNTEIDGPLTGTPTIPVVPTQPSQTGERELVRELIYVFQGIDGKIIRKSSSGEKFSLARGTSLPPYHKTSILKLAELGWLYTQIQAFIERQAAETTYGLVGQSFLTALRDELTEYYRLLAALEEKTKAGGVTLMQLGVWTEEPMKRMKLLLEIVMAVGTSRGGALASVLHGFLHHGDPGLAKLVGGLLTAACRPIYTMMLRWILDGNLEDPHQEFFIASDPTVQGDELWHHKYSVRKPMIPRFLGYSWTKQALSTGKSINFLSAVCRDSSVIRGRAGLMARLETMSPSSLFAGEVDNPLFQVMEEAYKCTSKHLLDVMFTKFQLLEHMRALRKYLLLGQGDIMRYLLDLLEGELSQPATQLYPHNLAGILETAIRGTNTQFEQADILQRLDVRLLEIQPGDTGWDVFSLDYKVTGPIGTVFTSDNMTRYLMLFNSLWRAKRMEWVLARVWQKLAILTKMVKSVRELGPILHMANLLASEMIHFVHQMAYYITFEVMECGWARLVKQIDLAESMDDVLTAHEEFLSTLVAKALLDERSREILTQLRAIYDRILEFQGIQERLYEDTIAEVEARKAREVRVTSKTNKGEYGTSAEAEAKDAERSKTYLKSKLASSKAQLRIVSQSYQDMVRTFLFQLTCSNDESLQGLSFRLDFNQHYKKKDSRLSRPLTFQHMRVSGINSPMSMASSLINI